MRNHKGKNNPNWKGGIKVRNGYRMIKKRGHHRAGQSGYVYEHILVAEEKLGRSLKKGEVVHHINGVKDDNRQDNLFVYDSYSEHISKSNGSLMNCAFELYKEGIIKFNEEKGEYYYGNGTRRF